MTSAARATSNSYITVDSFVIPVDPAQIVIFEKVIGEAIRRGDMRWLRFDTGEGVVSVMVTPASRVQTFLSRGEHAYADDASARGFEGSNIGNWIAEYIPRTNPDWSLVVSAGLANETDAGPVVAG